MKNIDIIFKFLKEAELPRTEFVQFMENIHNPFIVLISCILSLRTNDKTTYPATMRMLKLGSIPADFLKVSQEELEKAIFPVGFYKNKAQQILQIARELVGNYDSIVPDSIDELTKFKGVGRKTANLVLAKGFGIPAICVDVHVHRITNRIGLVKTKTPEETEFSLRKNLPVKYWIDLNTLLVTFGQNVCKPTNPKCPSCTINRYCDYYKINF